MNRVYPRGIECDDSKTTARLEGGDATAQKVSQRQLAQGLLRWVVLRES